MTEPHVSTRVVPHLTSTLGTRTREYLDGILGAKVGTFDAALNDEWTVTRRFAEIEHVSTVEAGEGLLAETRRKHLIELERQLRDVGLQMRSKSAVDLLGYLTTEQAFAWADVARLLGVSVPAIRKWRFDGGLSPESQARLADLVAFVKLFTELIPNASPSIWMSTPLVGSFTVTPKHLYSFGRASALLDVAQNGSSVTKLLDSWDPGWRERYDDRGFGVEHGPDGPFLTMK